MIIETHGSKLSNYLFIAILWAKLSSMVRTYSIFSYSIFPYSKLPAFFLSFFFLKFVIDPPNPCISKAGIPCIFPFIFEGVTYSKCTTGVNAITILWAVFLYKKESFSVFLVCLWKFLAEGNWQRMLVKCWWNWHRCQWHQDFKSSFFQCLQFVFVIFCQKKIRKKASHKISMKLNTVASLGGAWCATEVDANGVLVGNNWDYCSLSCLI